MEKEDSEDADYEDIDKLLLDDKKEDVNIWRINKTTEIIQDLLAKMAENNSSRASMRYPVVKKHLNDILQTLKVSEIPTEMTIEEFVICLDPPVNNPEYNAAMEKVDLMKKKTKCPLCPYKSTIKSDLKKHINTHFGLKLFKCGATSCAATFTSKTNLIFHVESKHLVPKLSCAICNKSFSCRQTLLGHMRLGHVNPVGQKVFVVRSPGVIKHRKFRTKHAKEGVYQLIGIPWKNSEGEIIDISIGFTGFQDIKWAATKLWRGLKKECQSDKMNERWVKTCGSAKSQIRKGNKMVPSLTFSFELYGIGIMATSQLKWYARRYCKAVKILATKESEFFLSSYNDIIKEKINEFTDKMGPKNRNHIIEHGEKFAM